MEYELASLLISAKSDREACAASCGLGLVDRKMGRFAEATRRFDDAIARDSESDIASRCRIYLAGLLAREGKFGEAREQLVAARRNLAAADRPLFELQLGFLCEFSERSLDALNHYTTATRLAQETSNQRIWSLAVNNRANVLNSLGRLGDAEIELRRLLAMGDIGSTAVLAQHNLGDVLGRRGSIREGIERIDVAASFVDQLATEHHRSGLSETAIVLEARLFRDAMERGTQWLAQAIEFGHPLEIPEFEVLIGRAAIGLSAIGDALDCFSRAHEKFAEQDRRTSEAQCAMVVGLLERHEIPDIGPDEPGADAVYEALIALGDHDSSLARTIWEAATRALTSERTQLRILGHYAQARLHLANGDASAAKAEATRLIDQLAEHTADINAVELRAALVYGLVDIEGLAVRIARAGEAHDMACLIDQANTVVYSVAPLSTADTEFVAKLDELRASLNETDPARIDRTEVELLEGRLRSLHRRMERTVAPSTFAGGIDQLRDPGCHQTVVMFAELDEHLWRLVLPSAANLGDGASLVDLGSRKTLTRAIREVRHSSDRLARRPSPIPEVLVAKLDRTAAALDDLLLANTGIQPNADVILFPGRFLTSVPWRALPRAKQWQVAINAGTPLVCRRDGDTLAAPVHVQNKRALIVAGPDLGDGIANEVAAVAAMYDDPIVLTGAAATVSAVLAAFEVVDIAHIAGHGSLHAKDPLLAMITLADGPLTVYDIEMSNATPPTVVLASCLVGSGASTGSDVSYGFASALASRGTTQLIISPVELDDAKTAIVMPQIHRSLAAGTSAREALDQLHVDRLDLERVLDSLLAVEAAAVS